MAMVSREHSFDQIIKRLRHLPMVAWVLVILTGLLFLAIIQLVMRFQLPHVADEGVIAQPRASSPELSLSQLAELHLFGQNMTNQDINALPQTSLNLELKGIYSAPSPTMGSAIIAAPDEAGRVYLAGDTLPGGAILQDVYEDRVVLRRAGKLEVLALPQQHLEIQK